MNEQTILTLVGQAGIGGILVWYLWYTVTVSQPKMLAEYREDLREERTQRNGLYRTLRDLVDELRVRPCMHDQFVNRDSRED